MNIDDKKAKDVIADQELDKFDSDSSNSLETKSLEDNFTTDSLADNEALEANKDTNEDDLLKKKTKKRRSRRKKTLITFGEFLENIEEKPEEDQDNSLDENNLETPINVDINSEVETEDVKTSESTDHLEFNTKITIEEITHAHLEPDVVEINNLELSEEPNIEIEQLEILEEPSELEIKDDFLTEEVEEDDLSENGDSLLTILNHLDHEHSVHHEEPEVIENSQETPLNDEFAALFTDDEDELEEDLITTEEPQAEEKKQSIFGLFFKNIFKKKNNTTESQDDFIEETPIVENEVNEILTEDSLDNTELLPLEELTVVDDLEQESENESIVLEEVIEESVEDNEDQLEVSEETTEEEVVEIEEKIEPFNTETFNPITNEIFNFDHEVSRHYDTDIFDNFDQLEVVESDLKFDQDLYDELNEEEIPSFELPEIEEEASVSEEEESIPIFEDENNFNEVIDFSYRDEIDFTSDFESLSKKINSIEEKKGLLPSAHEITFSDIATLVYSSEFSEEIPVIPDENLVEDTTAAIGLPRLTNIIDNIQEEPEQEIEIVEEPIQESIDIISTVKETDNFFGRRKEVVHSDIIYEDDNRVLISEESYVSEESIVPEELVQEELTRSETEKFYSDYSSDELLQALENGRYEQQESSQSQEGPVLNLTINKRSETEQFMNDNFVIPNRKPRKRQRRVEVEVKPEVNLQQEAERIVQETAQSISQRKKQTRRQLRRQEQLKQQQMLNQVASQPAQQPVVNEDNLIFTKVPPNILKGGITLFNNLAKQMQNNGALRVESLMSVLGALAGYSAQASAREKLVGQLRLSEDQVFSIVETVDGGKYYFGDSIDRALQKDKHSLWYMTATATYNLTGKIEANIDEIIRYNTRNMGKANYGVPRISRNLKPSHYPQYYVEHMWSALVPGLERFADDPMDWPTIFGVAIQRALIVTRNILDPNTSLKIVLESAVPMAFASVYPIELSTAKSKEDAEAKLISELSTEINIIRTALEDDNLDDQQKISLYKELNVKNDRLMYLLNK